MGRPHTLWRDSRGYWRCWIGGSCRSFGRDRRVSLRAFADAIGDDSGTQQATPTMVVELVERWLAHHGGDLEHRLLARFAEFAADLRAEDVDVDVLHRYSEWLRRQTYQVQRGKRRTRVKATDRRRHYAPKTVREMVLLAGRILRWAHGRSWLSIDPERTRLPKTPRQPRHVDPVDLKRVLTEKTPRRGRKALRPMPERTRRLCEFLVETGMRPGEACAMRWRDVNLEHRVCIIPEHKTAGRTLSARAVPLTNAAVRILSECPRAKEHVFLNRLGVPYTPTALRSALKRRGMVPYQLRHTFAQLRSESLPLDVLAKWLGHSNLETVNFYRRIYDERLRRAAASLPPLLPG